jgi:hypothetical protein
VDNVSGWRVGDRPAHTRPVVILGNTPVPRAPRVELERREPAIAARCQHCEAPLFGRGELEHTRRPGERIVRCPSCERPNLFYSAAWLSTDEGGTP